MGEDGERMSPEEVAEAIRSGTMVSQLLHFGNQKKSWCMNFLYNNNSFMLHSLSLIIMVTLYQTFFEPQLCFPRHMIFTALLHVIFIVKTVDLYLPFLTLVV